MRRSSLFARKSLRLTGWSGIIIAAALAAQSLAAAVGDTVTHITGDTTRQAFATGRPLLENAAYKIHASRREAPGLAEVHVEDTDIIYVLEGTATLVTGGEIVSPTRLSGSELRGAAISGGTARPLAKGDVIVVPHGTPHWFSEVHGPFLYYVVKTTAGVAGGQR